MRAQSILLMTLMGCPRPAPPPPTSAPAVPDAAPAITAPSATDWPAGAPAGPARRGTGAATDLRTLARAQDIFTVEAALPTLASLDSAGLDLLVTALAADPRWRVGVWQGREVAWRRCKTGGEWATGWGGYCDADGEQWRVMLVLDGDAPEDADEAGGGRYQVQAGPSVPDGWRSGTLRAAGPVVWLEIHERGTDLGLVRTATALSTLDLELAAMLEGRRGTLGATATGWQSTPTGTRYQARVDAGAGAEVWLRAPGHGEPGALSVESLIGDDALYEVTLPDSQIPTDPATLELWIAPEGEKARPLLPDDS